MKIDLSSFDNLLEIFNFGAWREELGNAELNASPYREFRFNQKSVDLRITPEHRVSVENGTMTVITCTTGGRNELHSVSLEIENLTPEESSVVAKPIIEDWGMHSRRDLYSAYLDGLAELMNWYETNPKEIFVAQTEQSTQPHIYWYMLVIQPVEDESKLLCNVTIYVYFTL